MRFDLDGLDVFFPYDRLYLEQYEYMRSLKRALDAGGHCLLEMPTGTGKTVCLLSLITSYQYANPSAGKLVYCTRTVPEMNSVMEELGAVLAYRAETLDRAAEDDAAVVPDETPSSAAAGATTEVRTDAATGRRVYRGAKRKRRATSAGKRMGPIHNDGRGAGNANVLALCLSSRRNMCVNDAVVEDSDREAVDSRCRSLTASWVLERAKARPGSIETCPFFDGLEGTEATSLPSGVYDLDELREWGRERGRCPYYLARRAVNHANVLVFNYQYVIDPKVARMVSRELEAESIVVFDEAHNIDSVCIEALSVDVDGRTLDSASRSLGVLTKEVTRVKASDGERLRREYNALLEGLADQGLLAVPPNDAGLADNVLSPDVLRQAVPGNIRRAEHFVAFMKKIVEYLRSRLRAATAGGGAVTSETPLAFLHRMTSTTSLEPKPLRFAYSRLASLLRTLQVSSIDEFNPLSDVADFCTLLSTYSDGPARFAVLLEPNGGSSAARGAAPGLGAAGDPVVRLACLDASLAIAPLFERFGSVVITSGTLSPLDLYPKLLRFEPRVSESFTMSTFRPCVRPLVVTRGSDQLPVSTRYDERGDASVVRNYGSLLVELCRAVPDGVVAFFTSYGYMESVVGEWDGVGVLRQLTESKLVFVETKDVVETTLALDNYRRACDSGRGAVFLSVARGKVSEGVNFDRHYGRAVIMFGVPFQYTLSHVLRARLEYLQTHFQIREQDFLNFDALRQTSQCIGRVIRSKTDYGLMILADARYARHDKRSKLPKWIGRFLHEHHLNLSTDTALAHARAFLRAMAQPVDQEALRNVLLTIEDVQRLCPNDPAAPTDEDEGDHGEGRADDANNDDANDGGGTTTDANGQNNGPR